MNGNLISDQEKTYFLLFLVIIFSVVLVRTAWISDDAAITLRTVLNFTHGYGPVFNITERVQVYTHPLWFLIISFLYLLVGNVFYTTFFLSFAFSVSAYLILVFRLSSSTEWAVIGALSLLLSKAFVDYSTSGLENPLSYFLLALFVLTFKKQVGESKSDLFKIVLLFSLIYLNRPDLVLLFFPMLLVAYYRIKNIKSAIIPSILGALPLITWLSFSLIYYGFLFPNTAYAKLGAGIDNYQLLLQGVRYFLDSADRDPITLTIICFSVILGFKNRTPLNLALSLGIVLYLSYILKIGGDFMSGRFFSVPFFAATILLVNQPRIKKSFFVAFSLLVVLIGSVSFNTTIFSDSKYHNKRVPAAGIADERGYYFQKTGLLPGNRFRFMNLPEWPKENAYKNTYSVEKKIQDVKKRCSIGYFSLYSGPFIHIVDVCGLADPLLAKLPAKYNPNWRIGHFYRNIPSQYLKSIRESKNVLEDKMLKKFYDKLNIITKSSYLFSTERLLTIFRMNLGQYSYLIDHGWYRRKPTEHITEHIAVKIMKPKQLNKVKPEGTRWNALGNTILRFDSKLVVDFRNTPIKNKWIDVSLDNNDRYVIIFKKNKSFVGKIELGPKKIKGGLARYFTRMPEDVYVNKFDTVTIEPVSGDGFYSVGHLLFTGIPH